MTCTECHAAKTKCDNKMPCSRCVRLQRECILHQSRQGKGGGGNKRKRRSEEEAIAASITAPPSAATVASASSMDCTKHYGIIYLIRSWISFAIRRRSFDLLARAATTASKCKLSMDFMLCDQGKGHNGMDFLSSTILLQSKDQTVVGDPLLWSEVPEGLKVATNSLFVDDSNLGDRWIWVREMNAGISRYYLSPAFARDVVTIDKIHETYISNEKPVVDLFIAPSERLQYVKAFAHQIALYKTPDDFTPKPNRLSGVLLITNNQGTVRVKQMSCLFLSDLDQGFFLVEYIPDAPKRSKKSAASKSSGSSVTSSNNSVSSASSSQKVHPMRISSSSGPISPAVGHSNQLMSAPVATAGMATMSSRIDNSGMINPNALAVGQMHCGDAAQLMQNFYNNNNNNNNNDMNINNHINNNQLFASLTNNLNNNLVNNMNIPINNTLNMAMNNSLGNNISMNFNMSNNNNNMAMMDTNTNSANIGQQIIPNNNNNNNNNLAANQLLLLAENNNNRHQNQGNRSSSSTPRSAGSQNYFNLDAFDENDDNDLHFVLNLLK